jgi:hypothetical protein
MSIEAFYQALAAGWPYKLVLITILSSFMGVTAIAFVRGRVQKKQAEYDATIRFLGVSDAQGRFADRAVINEYPWRSYIVPVTSATLVTMFGLISLLFAAELVEDAGRRSVILSALFEAGQEPGGDLGWQSMWYSPWPFSVPTSGLATTSCAAWWPATLRRSSTSTRPCA